MIRTAVIIGASGDVGRGVTEVLQAADWRVVAVARDLARLAGLGDIRLAGDMSTPDRAAHAAEAVRAAVGQPDLVVASINGPVVNRSISVLDGAAFAATFAANVVPHVEAVRAFLPILASGGTYMAVGGGMADLVFPGTAAVSAAQAAQRMIFRHLSADPPRGDVRILELMLYSMIAGHGSAERAEPHWITAGEVGRHVLAVVADPAAFAGPILRLRSRKQVGLPETA